MREEIGAKYACFSDENCIFAKSVNQQKQERMMENVIETGAQKHMEVTEMSKTYLVSIAKWTNFLAIKRVSLLLCSEDSTLCLRD